MSQVIEDIKKASEKLKKVDIVRPYYVTKRDVKKAVQLSGQPESEILDCLKKNGIKVF
jgi:hypothetical protein